MSSSAPPRFFGSREALRAMIAGHEMAAGVSRVAAEVLAPSESFDAALDLWSLCPERLLEPEDAVRVREVRRAREIWQKLKERFAR